MKFVYLFLLSIYFVSCNQYVDAEKFAATYEKECTVTEEIGEYEVSVLVVSPEYYEVIWGRKKLDSNLTIKLAIRSIQHENIRLGFEADPLYSSLLQGVEAYNKQYRYLSQTIGSKFKLVDKDNVQTDPLTFSYAKNWGMSNIASFLLVYPVVDHVDEFSLQINEFLTWNGVEEMSLQNCDDLKVKRD